MEEKKIRRGKPPHPLRNKTILIAKAIRIAWARANDDSIYFLRKPIGCAASLRLVEDLHYYWRN